MPDNESDEVVWLKMDGESINLISIFAVPQLSKFGRLLATKMTEMIGCERQGVFYRTPTPKRRKKFTGKLWSLNILTMRVMLTLRPGEQRTQWGLLYRRKYPAKLKEIMNQEHRKMVAEKLQSISGAHNQLD